MTVSCLLERVLDSADNLFRGRLPGPCSCDATMSRDLAEETQDVPRPTMGISYPLFSFTLGVIVAIPPIDQIEDFARLVFNCERLRWASNYLTAKRSFKGI